MLGSSSQASHKVVISKESWLQYKPIIENLYVTEALPLNVVRQQLRETHGFSASLSQYKRKLNEWRFAKNLKASDCRAIVSSLDRRGLTPETAKAIVRGRTVRPAQLQRALRRHDVPTWQRKRNQVRRCPTPDEVEVQSIRESPPSLAIDLGEHRAERDSEQVVAPLHGTSPMGSSLDAVDASVPSSRSPVMTFVEQGTSVVVQFLPPGLALRQPYQWDSRIPDAVRSGADPDSICRLLEKEANIDGIDYLSLTGLDYAVRSQDTQMVHFLLKNGASPQGFAGGSIHQTTQLSWSADDGFSQTALHRAVQLQSLPIVRLLLEYGALSRGRGKDATDDGIDPICLHAVPLSLAENSPNSELYEALVEAVALYLLKYTRVCCTTRKHELDPLLSVAFTETDASLIPVSCCFERALQLAVCCEKFRLLDLLLKHAKFQSLSQITSPLFIATWKGYKRAMEILTLHGVGVRAPHVCKFGTFDMVQAASFNGWLAEVLPFLKAHGADVNGPALGFRGRTALQHAVERGDRKMIDFLLNWGADVNADAAERQGLTALQAAAFGGRKDLASLLLQCGARVNAPPAKEGGYTALSAAIASGSHIIFRRLLQAGATLNPVEWDQYDVYSIHLLVAIRNRAHDFVQELLDFGLDVCSPLIHGLSLAEFAILEADRYHCVSIIWLILERSSSIKDSVMDIVCDNLIKDEAGNQSIRQPLIEAASLRGVSAFSILGPNDAPIFRRALRAGNFHLTEYLIRHKAQALQASDDHKNLSAFESACKDGDLWMCRQMLRYGANANAFSHSNKGRTPLLDACQRREFALAKQLVEYGADVNASDESCYGTTALLYVGRKDAIDLPEAMQLVNMLLDCGADANASDKTYRRTTPLLEACFRGHVKVVEALLCHNVDVNVTSPSMGYTALMTACHGGLVKVDVALVRQNADASAPSSPYTALRPTFRRENIEIVRMLLLAGANVTPTGSYFGPNPITWAAREGHLELLELLLQYWPHKLRTDLRLFLGVVARYAQRGSHRDVEQFLDTYRRTIDSRKSNGSLERGLARRVSEAIHDSEEDSEDDGEDK